MKHRWIILIILPVLAIAGLAAWLMRKEPIDVTAATVERGRVEQTVSAILSGEVQPQQDALVSAAYFGPVIQVHAMVGDRVQQGDLILELDHAELDARVRLAETALQAGRHQLERLKERESSDVSKALDAVPPETYAPVDPELLKRFLERQGQSPGAATPMTEPDALGLALPQELFDTLMSPQLDRELAQFRVDQLEAALDGARSLRERAFIRAPIGGMIAKLYFKKGETVGIGLPVARIVNDSAFHVEAPFDESAAATLAIGQPARIELDAYRGVILSGTVSAISPVVSVNPDMSRTLTVTLDIDTSQAKLLPGMSADVTVVTDAKENALVIPAEALIRDEFVYVIENGRARRRSVEPGMGNWKTREIVSGLAEGERVVTSVSNEALDDGAPVRIVERLAGLD